MTDRVESMQIDLDELVALLQRVTELEDLLLEKVNLNSELADHLGDVEVEFAALKDLTINQVMEELAALKAGQGEPVAHIYKDCRELLLDSRMHRVTNPADWSPLYTSAPTPTIPEGWQQTLAKLEWSKPYSYCTGWPSCPVCGGIKPGHGADENGNLPDNQGHRQGCNLQAMIAAAAKQHYTTEGETP